MSDLDKKEIKSNYGLIGNDLELKKNIDIEIDKNGKIRHLYYDDIREGSSFSVKKKYFFIDSWFN